MQKQQTKQFTNPPPPPIFDLKPPEVKLDPTIKLLIDQHPSTHTSQSDQLKNKRQKLQQSKPNWVHESVGDPKSPKPINKQTQVECNICNKWCMKDDMAMHKQSHGSKILDWLFLGGSDSASNLKELQERICCNYILNCAQQCSNSFEKIDKFKYKRLSLNDNMHENIIACFEDALEFIGIEIAKVEEARINNKHVLVHCALGKSRSASIVIAYLMKYQKMTLREAYQYGKSRRPVVSPNPNYIRQLREFQRILYGTNSIQGHEILPVYKFLYRHEYQSKTQ